MSSQNIISKEQFFNDNEPDPYEHLAGHARDLFEVEEEELGVPYNPKFDVKELEKKGFKILDRKIVDDGLPGFGCLFGYDEVLEEWTRQKPTGEIEKFRIARWFNGKEAES